MSMVIVWVPWVEATVAVVSSAGKGRVHVLVGERGRSGPGGSVE